MPWKRLPQGVEAGGVGAVLYRGRDVGKAGNALNAKGTLQGRACPTVRKHGMDRLEDAAPVRGQPRSLDQVRGVIRRLHYSIRTEQAYVDWIRRFILFHRKRHPAETGAPEVEAFLTHLAVQGKAARRPRRTRQRDRVPVPATISGRCRSS